MTYKEFVENFENIFRKFEKLAHEETIQYWNGLTTEEKLEVISYVTTPSKDIYDIEKYKPLEELKKELKRFEDLGAVVDFISDLDNTEIYIYKLINNARKFTNSFNKDYIDDIEKNIKDAIEFYLEDNNNPCEILLGEFELEFKIDVATFINYYSK